MVTRAITLKETTTRYSYPPGKDHVHIPFFLVRSWENDVHFPVGYGIVPSKIYQRLKCST